MGLIDDWLKRNKSRNWLHGFLPNSQAAPILPDQAYVTILLRSIYIPVLREAFKEFYGAAHSFIRVAHQAKVALDFHVFTSPDQLRNLDANRVASVIIGDQVLLNQVPFRGGAVRIELGLFALRQRDLLGPFVQVLSKLSDSAGVSFAKQAGMFLDPFVEGVRLLTNTADDTILAAGIAKDFVAPQTGDYLISGADVAKWKLSDFTAAPDGILLDAGGQPINAFPYMVIRIQQAGERPTFFEIPDIKDAYDKLFEAVRADKPDEIVASRAIFKRTVLTSADLLWVHAQKLVEEVEKRVDAITGVKVQSVGDNALPALRGYHPF